MSFLPPPAIPAQLTAIKYVQEGAVATIAFNRPDQLNALSPELIEETLIASTHVAADKEIRVLIIRSEGRAFSAGVDLKAASAPGWGRADKARFSGQARELCRLWETMRQVVIARVHGYCFTGGLELALAADLIICADDAQFCDTHAKVGLRSGWGISQRLPRRVGIQRAREMSFTSRRVPADEALRIGLVLDAVPADKLDERVGVVVDGIIGNSGDALAAYKDLFDRSQNLSLTDALAWEATADYPILDGEARRSATVSKLGKAAG